MKRLVYLITPLLIFTLLFSACSPTEKDNYKHYLTYFQIDFVKSDFELTESTLRQSIQGKRDRQGT